MLRPFVLRDVAAAVLLSGAVPWVAIFPMVAAASPFVNFFLVGGMRFFRRRFFLWKRFGLLSLEKKWRS